MILSIVLSALLFLICMKKFKWQVLFASLFAMLAGLVFYFKIVLNDGMLTGFALLGIYLTVIISLNVNAALHLGTIIYHKKPVTKPLAIWLALLLPLDFYTWWTLFAQDKF